MIDMTEEIKHEIKHIGIILDGNRRYAKKLGLQPWKGHEDGAKKVNELIDEILNLKIRELTLYTFSTENFKRPKVEVDFLMKLFKKGFEELMSKKGYMESIRIRFIGDKSMFPDDISSMMKSIEEKTNNNSDLILNFAMAYGGRNELVNAIRNIVKKKIDASDIDEKIVSENLYIKDDVDLIIRTSGEKRTSGFLPWQGVYAELIFIDKLWPDFTKEDLHSCIEEFNNRKRRFGQ